MTVIRVRGKVGEDRKLLLTLPPEVPPGEHDFEVTVRDVEPIVFEVLLPPDDRPKAFPPRPTNPELAEEHDAFERMLPELMTLHGGKFIAVKGGVVVAVADTEVGALTTAHQLQPGSLVLVRKVTDQPQPIERLPSFRPVRTE
jgi:hypothetical protein